MAASLPLVVVSVGTDHHRFDRLIGWLDEWPGVEGVSLFVQHGPAAPSRHGRNVDFLAHDELLSHFSAASAVILQGGPGGIIDSLRCGVRPIVVPRLARFREVVDDHQVGFSRRMAAAGIVELAETQDALYRHLARLGPRAGDRIDLTRLFQGAGGAVITSRLAEIPQRLPTRQRWLRISQLLHAGARPNSHRAELMEAPNAALPAVPALSASIEE